MRGAPTPTNNFWLSYPNKLYIVGKGDLSESPNHFKYRKNILISRFYEQFSRSSRILGHFGSLKKFQTLRTQIYHISFWSGWSGDFKYIICFAKNSSFAVLWKHLRISRNTLMLLSSRNLNISFAKQIIYLESPDHPLQNDIWYVCVLRVEIFSNFQKWLKFRLLRENCS